MADEVVATNKGGDEFAPHVEGQFAARCADVINLGQRIEQYADFPEHIVDKAVVVFLTNADGETTEIAREFTVSMNEKANLRKFLESWRGKGYTEDQVRAGVPLHKLVGQPALISVAHAKSAKGRTYAKIMSVAPLPKQMAVLAPEVDGYERAAYWADRKRQYADECKAWVERQEPKMPFPAAMDDPFPDEDGDIPF